MKRYIITKILALVLIIDTISTHGDVNWVRNTRYIENIGKCNENYIFLIYEINFKQKPTIFSRHNQKHKVKIDNMQLMAAILLEKSTSTNSNSMGSELNIDRPHEASDNIGTSLEINNSITTMDFVFANLDFKILKVQKTKFKSEGILIRNKLLTTKEHPINTLITHKNYYLLYTSITPNIILNTPILNREHISPFLLSNNELSIHTNNHSSSFKAIIQECPNLFVTRLNQHTLQAQDDVQDFYELAEQDEDLPINDLARKSMFCNETSTLNLKELSKPYKPNIPNKTWKCNKITTIAEEYKNKENNKLKTNNLVYINKDIREEHEKKMVKLMTLTILFFIGIIMLIAVVILISIWLLKRSELINI